jgi:hypothetical protein
LLISPDNLVQNHIDKQVLQLANKPFVSDVSVNRNFIFIVPNYGEQVFNNFTMTYSYLPQTVRDVNAKIDELTKASDINKSEYQFVSTGYTP